MEKHKPSRQINIKKLFGLAFGILIVVRTPFGQSQDNSLRLLDPNQTIEQEMTGAEIHRYRFVLQAGEFFQVRVEQKGADVTLRLADTTGKVLVRMNSSNTIGATETLSFVATNAGEFVLEVGGFNAWAEKGRYKIEREASRAASSTDKRRVEVERVFIEGLTARDYGQHDPAINALTEAWKGWQELQDAPLVELTAREIKQLRQVKAIAIFNEGVSLSNAGTAESLRASVARFESARELYKETRDEQFQGTCLAWLGSVSYQLGENQKALDYYNQAVLILRAGADKHGEARALAAIGVTYFALGETQKALESHNQALLLQREIRDQIGEGTSLVDIGVLLTIQGDKKRGLEYLQEALLLTRTTDNKAGEGAALANIGALYEASGEMQQARDYYLLGLPLVRGANNKYGEGRILVGLGNAYLTLGDYGKALETYSKALLIEGSLEDKGSKRLMYANLGLIHISLGNSRKALEFYVHALPLQLAVSDKLGEGRVLAGIGSAYLALGDGQHAREYFDRALKLQTAIDDEVGRAATLAHVGASYLFGGELHKAFSYFSESLSFHKALGNKFGEARVLNGMGSVYWSLGEKQKALDYYDQALSLQRIVDDKSGEASVLGNIGSVYLSFGEIDNALDYFMRALPLMKMLREEFSEAATLNNIGSLYLQRGDNHKALTYFNQALALRRKIEDKRGEGSSLAAIGVSYSNLGDNQKALDYLNQALLVNRMVEDRITEASTLNNLRNTWQVLGNPRLAILYGKESVNKYQELRGASRGLDNDVQKSLLRSARSAYEMLAELLIGEGQLKEAIQVLNLYQDQQFFDFHHDKTSAARQTIFSQRETEFANRSESAFQKAENLNSQVEELKDQIGARDATEQESVQLRNLRAELQSASDGFLALLKNGQNEFPKLADEKDNVSLVPDVLEMQEILTELKVATSQTTVALYTLVGGNKTYVLFMTTDRLQVFGSSIKSTDLNRKILHLYALLQSPDFDPRPLSKELYDAIVGPIDEELKRTGARTLLWSLDGSMRYVPMAALHDGKQYLVERYNQVLFTRTHKEGMTRAANPTWTGYGFANAAPHTVQLVGDAIDFKSLDFGRHEMEIFRTKTHPNGIIEGDVFADAQFNKASLLRIPGKPRPVVHISSHFRFHPGDPSRSFLLLGDGQVMTLAELKDYKNIFAGVELLTLSACDTAAQRPDANGREIDGFAELAQRLGAGAVMASLWSVSDQSTAELLKRFYKNHQGGKYNKADALRQAQLDLLYGRNAPTRPARTGATDLDIVVDHKYRSIFRLDQKKPFAHPYYWSPFVLFGNWK